MKVCIAFEEMLMEREQIGEKRGEERGEARGEARGIRIGEALGEKRGEERGAQRAKLDVILLILGQKGSVPLSLTHRLEKEKNLSILDSLIEKAISAESIEVFEMSLADTPKKPD